MNKKLYKEKLEAEEKLLVEELGVLGRINSKGNWEAVPESETNTQEVQDEADIAERAEDFEEKSIKLDSLKKRLEDVKRALKEIDTDQYGVCKSCNKEIEEDRMEANPAAQTCKSCMDK